MAQVPTARTGRSDSARACANRCGLTGRRGAARAHGARRLHLMRAFRIVKKRHALTAFSGDGARAYGGRWNFPGIPMVYSAHTRALVPQESGVLLNPEHPDIDKIMVMYPEPFTFNSRL